MIVKNCLVPKKSFRILALSASSSYTIPSFSRGGIEALEAGEINVLSIDHHALDEVDSDLNFVARFSFSFRFESRIISVTVFLSFLNFSQ